jgi:hypothetical protein
VNNVAGETDRSALFGGAVPAGIQTKDVMRDDFGFEIPVESIPLPSAGLIYPEESPIHCKETVDIRSMTAREEDILTSRALIKKGTVITELIKSCLTDKRIQVPDMVAGDRNAIMVALRITGYGAEYDVEADCPKCGTRSKQQFNLADMPIKRLEIEPVAKGQNSFEFKLPVTKKTVHFKFLTGRDEEEISTIQERAKKQGALADNIVTTRLQYSIISIDGKTDRSSINGFIRNMPARDSMSLRKYIEANEPGIEMKGEFDCGSCGEQSEVRVPLGASFFWPEA